MGVSGGGQYALACAFMISPEELRSVALVCGQGPVEISLRGMKFGNQIVVRGFQYCPSFIRLLMHGVSWTLKLLNMDRMSNESILQRVQTLNRWNLLGVPEMDRKVMADPDTMLAVITSVREHFRQGVDGCLEEGRITTSHLGFDLRDVKRNVRLWKIPTCPPLLERRLLDSWARTRPSGSKTRLTSALSSITRDQYWRTC